jgi:hypothetical protein
MKNMLFHFGHKAASHRPAEGDTCHNCHAPVSTAFCGACGQKAAVHVASTHEFLHHYVGHFIAAEGKLWRTLVFLFAKPGQLTVEYIRGRRGQFIDPLRLLLTMSLLAFLAMKWQVHHLPAAHAETASPQAAVAATAAVAKKEHKYDGMLFDVFAWASDQFAGNYGKFMAQPKPVQDAQFWEGWLRSGPTIVLCLIPLMALALKLLHLGRGWCYGEHLVFAMHLQCVFLLALIVDVGGIHGTTIYLLGAALGLYILMAMRKVYGGGWALLLVRMGLFSYCLIQGLELLARIAFMSRMT